MAGSRPAIDLTRPRSTIEILSATMRLYALYPALFAVLALSVIAPYDLIVLALSGRGPLSAGPLRGIELLLPFVTLALITPLISALHVNAVTDIAERQHPRLLAVAARGVSALPVVAAASVMAFLGIGLGLIALVVPGVILWLRWSVVAQSAALDRAGWYEALSSSGRLTRGHYWHVFGLLLVTNLIKGLLSSAAKAIPLGSGSGVASVSAGIVVDTALASFSALTIAVLYFDLRARQLAQPYPTDS